MGISREVTVVFPRRVLAVVGIAVVVSTWLVTPSSGSQFPMGLEYEQAQAR